MGLSEVAVMYEPSRSSKVDSCKTVVSVGVLAAIAYGVYVGINNNPQLTPPPGATEGWASSPPDMPE